jgi:hypothetical protein
MCYFLFLASPLTLTEVRSMLPAGATADLAAYREQQLFKSLHPSAQTVAKLLVGRCSCDLVRQRLSQPRDDERHLRERYRALQLPRSAVIQALERHRAAGLMPALGAKNWAEALAAFVVEHARNAGPSLFFLHFGPGEPDTVPGAPRHLAASEVRRNPGVWLTEATPTLVH